MKSWNDLPSKETVEKTAEALRANGFEVVVVANKEAAKRKALELIPAKAEVFTMPSMTLEATGIAAAINESGAYDAVRAKLVSMDMKTQGREMRKLGAGPDVSVGSVHALTEDGKFLVASLTGSQIPAYAYGAGTAIFVVSTKKIVKNLDEAWNRLVEHVVPQESVRARKAYGLPDSFNSYPSKVLVFNREVQPGRVKIILMNEDAGF
ncbi:MAG: LUD domain-containing protein [Spirochaetales bacterium]